MQVIMMCCTPVPSVSVLHHCLCRVMCCVYPATTTWDLHSVCGMCACANGRSHVLCLPCYNYMGPAFCLWHVCMCQRPQPANSCCCCCCCPADPWLQILGFKAALWTVQQILGFKAALWTACFRPGKHSTVLLAWYACLVQVVYSVQCPSVAHGVECECTAMGCNTYRHVL